MTNSITRSRPRLLLIGGGHSHAIVLAEFAKTSPAADVTLVSIDALTPYSGMLPGVVAGHYEALTAHIALGPLAVAAGTRFVQGEVVKLNLDKRIAELDDGSELAFDMASIDVGTTPDLSVPGALESVVPVKPIGQFLRRFEALLQRSRDSEERPAIAVVGAGAGGLEVLLAMQHRINPASARNLTSDPVKFSLYCASADLLPGFHSRVQSTFARVCAERDIEVHVNARVSRVSKGELLLDDGSCHQFDEVIWCTGAAAPKWLAASGLHVDERGFVAVNTTLESVSHAGVFAAGDCASVTGHPRPKAGVFAVRQGLPLARNLTRAAADMTLLSTSQKDRFLSLITTGDRHAVASRQGLPVLQGKWVWHWKDHIDRRFMRRFMSGN